MKDCKSEKVRTLFLSSVLMSNKSILYIHYSNIIHSQWKGSFTTKTSKLQFVNVESLDCDETGVEPD